MSKQQYRSFYSQDEMNIVNENLSSIIQKADKIFNDKYLEPNNDEYHIVRGIIINFIKSKKRLVYGGYAQNELIKVKNQEDDFYGDCRADIEFYSPEPLKDLIELCDLINEKKIFNVKGDEGMHPETYKIYANLENYCDMSYMDPHIYNNCPFIELNGFKMTHPHMMIIDGYRVYTDLLTSRFRLEKTYIRNNLLEKHYPLPLTNENESYKQYLNKEKQNEILRNIRKLIIMNSKFVVVGHYGVEYLTKKINDETIQVKNYPYYQLITSNLKEDYLKIYNILKSIYGRKISYKKYYKYFMFWDQRIEFYFDNQVILKLYGNNDKCIVHQYSEKKKTYFGTFQLLILYLLIDYNYAQVNNIKHEEKNFLILLNKLFKSKDLYMNENQLNILDPSGFQHFTTECFGDPGNPLRDPVIKRIKNVKKGKMFKFSYFPKEGKKGVVPVYKFNNSSGLLIDTSKKKK